MTIDEIRQRYAELAKDWGFKSTVFPYDSIPRGDGSEHVEFLENGRVALVGTDRGVETSRKETGEIDELMYWLFEGYAYSRGWNFELENRHPTDDSRRIVFARAREEIGRISQEWANRMMLEQTQILKENPYLDKE